jgi:K+-transporting ATPase ATPase C chain
MKQVMRRVFGMFALLTLVTGVLYPLAVLGIAQAVFTRQANGNLILRGGVLRGSTLLGQPFTDARYFHGRPSATIPRPYQGGASSGSNLGPLNPALATAVAERVAALRTTDRANTTAVPVDLVTASGSGLDPHITPAAALYQVGRVARARGLSMARVQALLAEHTAGRTFGVLGEPRVNVLELNLALDVRR